MADTNDIWCVEDLDPFFTPIGGLTALGQKIVRRITCDRGLNLADTEGYGINVRSWLNKSYTTQQVFNLETVVEHEVSKEPQVRNVRAEVIPNIDGSFVLKITVQTTEEGKFSLSIVVKPPVDDIGGEEDEVAVTVTNVDQSTVTVTGVSASYLPANALRKGLTVQNLSRVADAYYAISKSATIASLIIPANSEKVFDPVPLGSLHMMTVDPLLTATVKIEEGY